MQVFLPFKSPLETAKCLDKRRLHKQIVECYQIMKAIKGESQAWKNHPICKMYKDNLKFLEAYTKTLELYKELSNFLQTNIQSDLNLQDRAERMNKEALSLLPSFITEEYCDIMKRRLYTKNNNYYSQFAELGECDYNLYFVDGEWWKYINGKKIQL